MRKVSARAHRHMTLIVALLLLSASGQGAPQAVVVSLEGTNLEACPQVRSVLTATTSPPDAIVTWFLNGSQLSLETSNQIDVNGPGIYEARLGPSVRSIEVVRLSNELRADTDQDSYFITQEPRMPNLVADITSAGGPTAGVESACHIQFDRNLTLEFCPNAPNNHDIDTTTPVSLGAPTDAIRGGIFKCSFSGFVNGCQAKTTASARIFGTNPRGELIAALTNPVVRRIAQQKSGCRQFDAPADGGSSFCPLIGKDGSVGIMQVADPTDEEVWNWRANVDRGVALFNERLEQAKAYPGRVAATQGFVVLVTRFNERRAAQGLPSVKVTLPAFESGDLVSKPGQLELDAIRGYDGWFGTDQFGLELHEFKVAVDRIGGEDVLRVVVPPGSTEGQAGWEPVLPAERPQTPGDPAFVTNVLAASGCGVPTTTTTCNIDIRMNRTVTDDDDFVVVSAPGGAVRPSTELTITLAAPSGTLLPVVLSHTGTGQVSFSNAVPILAGGTPVTVQVFGDSKSAAQNDTTLRVTSQNVLCTEQEDVTVITGIKLQYAGTFFFATNNNDKGPEGSSCDGVNEPESWFFTPLPCEGLNTNNMDRLIFEEIPEASLRWTTGSGKRPKVEVSVQSVKTFGPEVKLDGLDPHLTIGKFIRARATALGSAVANLKIDDCNGNGSTSDDDSDIVHRFGVTVGSVFDLRYVDPDDFAGTVTRMWRRNPDLDGPTLSAFKKADAKDVDTVFFPGTDEGCVENALTFVLDTSNPLDLACKKPLSVKQLFVNNTGTRSFFRGMWGHWTSRRLALDPGPDFDKSFIARLFMGAILGHPKNVNADALDNVFAEAFFQLSNYDWYSLVGSVDNGVVATPGGIGPQFREFAVDNGCPKPLRPPADHFNKNPFTSPTRRVP